MISKITPSNTHDPTVSIDVRGFLFYGLAGLFVILTLVCMFTPSPIFFKTVAANTLYVMMGLFAAGFVMFFLKQERLMIISLLCCCTLCLHLKASSNKQMRLSQMTENPAISISHVSLSNAENDYDSVINYLLSIETDFVSFQELTPDWNIELTNRLSPSFPYVQTMVRMDQYGMGFFSKVPMELLDTVYYENVPNLATRITLGGKPCNIISCQLIPPVNQSAFISIEKHFAYLNTYMKGMEGSRIVVGDLHLPPWASEVQHFKETSQLLDSRRDINPRNIDGSVSLPRIPVEHIFFSDDFSCISFTELGNSVVGRVGITGMYQLLKGPVEIAE